MSINRQLPGPAIQVCRGDLIIVDAVNQAHGTAAAIHWHGQHMVATPWSDGVPFVTQCPIHFANSFRYHFWATEVGTHFYHSHSGEFFFSSFLGFFFFLLNAEFTVKGPATSFILHQSSNFTPLHPVSIIQFLCLQMVIQKMKMSGAF